MMMMMMYKYIKHHHYRFVFHPTKLDFTLVVFQSKYASYVASFCHRQSMMHDGPNLMVPSLRSRV